MHPLRCGGIVVSSQGPKATAPSDTRPKAKGGRTLKIQPRKPASPPARASPQAVTSGTARKPNLARPPARHEAPAIASARVRARRKRGDSDVGRRRTRRRGDRQNEQGKPKVSARLGQGQANSKYSHATWATAKATGPPPSKGSPKAVG